MTDSGGESKSGAGLPLHHEVDFLPDVGPSDASRRARDHRSATVVQRVVRIVEPVLTVSRSCRPRFVEREVESAANVPHVLPADEIGQTIFVVSSRVELIESLLSIVSRVGVTRRLVVLTPDSGCQRGTRQGVSQKTMGSPRPNRLIAE